MRLKICGEIVSSLRLGKALGLGRLLILGIDDDARASSAKLLAKWRPHILQEETNGIAPASETAS
jgi:hypothetical protein